VAAVLRFYPASYRARFSAELLTAFDDQLDAIRSRAKGQRVRVVRLTAVTVFGLLRALIPTHVFERRRAARLARLECTRTNVMKTFMADARYVLRTFRKETGFTLVAVLTLALGIGANTAVFSVLNSVILAPLPYSESDGLVRLYTAYRQNPSQSTSFSTGPDLVEIRDQVDAFSSVAMMYTYREIGLDLTTDGAPQRIRALRVNAEYFETYGATPLLGRWFTRDEERDYVLRVVLSNHLWNAYANGDPDVIGRSVDLNGAAYEVIGVMRATFADVVAGPVDAWIPQHLEVGTGGNNRNNHYLTAVARLSTGVSVTEAQAQVNVVMSRLESEYRNNENRTMRVIPLHEDIVRESKAPLYVLMGAAGLVLLIACINVANLFLARSVARTRETAIRTALGAAWARVLGQQLTESVLLAALGGLIGSIVAYWGVQLLLAVSPESLARAEEVGFDSTLLAFALLTTVLTGLLFGAAPAVRASRVDPNEALHEGSRGNTGGRGANRARSVLVATQVSLALVLLIGTGILLKSFAALQSVDLGFDSAAIATFEVHLPSSRYGDPEQRVEFHHQFQDRLEGIPGVQAVSATSWLPANGHYHEWAFEYLDDAGMRQWIPAMVRIIEGEFFDALGIDLVSGRTFTRLDRSNTEPVGVISESMARAAYGDGDPLGGAFITGGEGPFTVVGVVADVAYDANGTGFETIYLSHGQYAYERNWGLTYAVKMATDPELLFGPARTELAAMDPALVLYHPRSMDDVLGTHRAREQFTLVLMAVFATVALCLAAVGIYGVLSYTVSRRTHEIGVRVALGARPGQVRGIVMLHGAAVAGVGMVLGIAGALGLSSLLQSLVFAVSTKDPTVFVAVPLLLALVVAAASYMPARRATKVDPLDALRSE